jgi:hypothetical protein
VDYYVSSHLHSLETTKGIRSLHEIPPSELARVNSKPEEKNFPDGSMCVPTPHYLDVF